jgi:calcineurin-like phosphoesterase family protein
MEIFFISDMHFNDNNIIKFANREFQDVVEMNMGLIQNWNRVVTKKDIVFNLGDFGKGTKSQIRDIISQLQCKRHNLILGNHDREIFSPTIWRELGFTNVYDFPILYNFFICSHEPVFLEHHSVFGNIYGHTHQNKYHSATSFYFNTCVEWINYTPISYDLITEAAKKFNENIENKACENLNRSPIPFLSSQVK